MENTQNRNDIYNFFKDMPTNQQQEVISKLNRQIKKPPEPTDINVGQSESEVIHISQLCVK